MCLWLHSVMVLSREYQFVFSWFYLKLNNTCCWWEGSNWIRAFWSMKLKNWSSYWCKTHVLGTKHMYLLEAKQINDLQISLLFHCIRINFKNPRECRVDSFNEAKIGDASLEKGFLTKFAKLNVESWRIKFSSSHWKLIVRIKMTNFELSSFICELDVMRWSLSTKKSCQLGFCRPCSKIITKGFQ